MVMSSFTGLGAAAQLTQGFVDEGVTKKNVALAGLTVVGLGATDDIIRLGTTNADGIAALAQNSGRVGLTGEKTRSC